MRRYTLWFGPKRGELPRPRKPVRPNGFLWASKYQNNTENIIRKNHWIFIERILLYCENFLSKGFFLTEDCHWNPHYMWQVLHPAWWSTNDAWLVLPAHFDRRHSTGILVNCASLSHFDCEWNLSRMSGSPTRSPPMATPHQTLGLLCWRLLDDNLLACPTSTIIIQ